MPWSTTNTWQLEGSWLTRSLKTLRSSHPSSHACGDPSHCRWPEWASLMHTSVFRQLQSALTLPPAKRSHCGQTHTCPLASGKRYVCIIALLHPLHRTVIGSHGYDKTPLLTPVCKVQQWGTVLKTTEDNAPSQNHFSQNWNPLLKTPYSITYCYETFYLVMTTTIKHIFLSFTLASHIL